MAMVRLLYFNTSNRHKIGMLPTIQPWQTRYEPECFNLERRLIGAAQFHFPLRLSSPYFASRQREQPARDAPHGHAV